MSNLINIMDKSPLKHTVKKIEGEKVVIKTYLDMAEFFSAVHTVADNCFTIDKETKEEIYKPEYLEPAWRYMVLKYFTDIDVSDTPVAEVFKVTQSSWYKEIELEIADNPVYYEINKAVERIIADKISLRKTSFDRLCDDLSGMITVNASENINDIKEVLDGLSKVNTQDFVEAAIRHNLGKDKDGDENGGEES